MMEEHPIPWFATEWPSPYVITPDGLIGYRGEDDYGKLTARQEHWLEVAQGHDREQADVVREVLAEVFLEQA